MHPFGQVSVRRLPSSGLTQDRAARPPVADRTTARQLQRLSAREHGIAQGIVWDDRNA